MVNALLYFSPQRMQYKNYPNFLICVKSSKIWKFKRQNKEKIQLQNFSCWQNFLPDLPERQNFF